MTSDSAPSVDRATVLVAAASKHGGTAEIADALGQRLSELGHACAVRSIEEVDSVGAYAAVVLGSGVYEGRWLRQARQFVDTHADELTGRPTWLFSSGPLGDPPKPAPDQAVQIDAIVEATGARDHRVFSGRLDRDDLGLVERTVVRAVHAPVGDFREWGAVASWAEAIADELEASP